MNNFSKTIISNDISPNFMVCVFQEEEEEEEVHICGLNCDNKFKL